MKTFRPPAVPLVNVDPYFNAWSVSNELTDEKIVHWSYDESSAEGTYDMIGMISINDEVYRFLGHDDQLEGMKTLKQIKLEVKPLTTIYEFTGGGINLKVEFMTPLFLDDIEILSRPVTYINFEVSSLDTDEKSVKIYFDVSSEWCVHEKDQEVVWARSFENEEINNILIGNAEQNELNKSGDHVRIDWGHFHLLIPRKFDSNNAIVGKSSRKKWANQLIFPKVDDLNMPRTLRLDTPVMATELIFPAIRNNDTENIFIALAYDDNYSIEYFGQKLKPYWKKNQKTFSEMIKNSIEEYEDIKNKSKIIDSEIIKEATSIKGEKYADIVSLAYRQAISAHKLVEDENGDLLFLSKENDSNGCMATVDISYPSMPIFLRYNPELIKGMLRPIFRFARSDEWEFNFAPHDIGTYPLGNGQVYGENKLENQMPIEESGNILIIIAAMSMVQNDYSFAKENWDLITKWADYLLEHGMDPGEQLCTDDFAGHLAHNTNLSLKAIIGIRCFGLLSEKLGEYENSEKVNIIAQEMAVNWEQMAAEDSHYKLSFDQTNSWSLKYNLVWDELLSFNLFSSEVKEKESDFYMSKLNTYGVPLDSREKYTKADWLLWVVALSKNDDYQNRIIDSIWNYLNQTESRVPFSDWYDTESGKRVGFKSRSVVGGMYLLFLNQESFK